MARRSEHRQNRVTDRAPLTLPSWHLLPLYKAHRVSRHALHPIPPPHNRRSTRPRPPPAHHARTPTPPGAGQPPQMDSRLSPPVLPSPRGATRRPRTCRRQHAAPNARIRARHRARHRRVHRDRRLGHRNSAQRLLQHHCAALVDGRLESCVPLVQLLAHARPLRAQAAGHDSPPRRRTARRS